MTTDWIKRGFRYEWWANREVLNGIAELTIDISQIESWFAHILAAEMLWLNRLQSAPQEMAVWPELSTDESRDLLTDLEARWTTYLQSLSDSDLGREFSYTNSEGEPWISTVGDTLMHVLLHASYHRGQIASAMRKAGIDPPLTDYIHATRSGLVNPDLGE